MVPYLRFYVNPRKDKEYVKKYFPVFEEMLGKKRFEELVKRQRKIERKLLEKEMEKIEGKWRKVEKRFFEVTAQKFGRWRRRVYFCHLSSTYICGGGYEYPTIIVFPFSEHLNPLHTIMHELLHLHVIEDVRKLCLKPKNFFEFGEIAVAFMSREISEEFGLPILFPTSRIERKFRKIEKKVGLEREWSERIKLIESLL